jgi:hypothetical protein
MANENLKRLQSRVDDFFAGIVTRHAEHLACGEGCSSCCKGRLSLFVVELEPMLEAVSALDPALRSRIQARAARDPEECPLLEDNRCSVYAVRPIICRSHGAPILVRPDDPEAPPTRDVCPLNFAGPLSLAALPGPDLLDLERLNSMLSLVNRLAMAEAGGEERVDLRQALTMKRSGLRP